MKKQALILTLAIALCILLFGIYFAFLIHNSAKENAEKDQTARTLVTRFTSSDISGLSFNMSGREITLRRRNGRWILPENENLPVNADTVKTLIDEIEIITAIRVIDEDAKDLSEYRLDTPVYTLKVTAHSKEHVFYFGEYSKYYDGYYFCAKDNSKVYIVSSSYVETFNIEFEELLENDTLPDISSATHIDFTSLNGASYSFDTESLTKEEKRLWDALKSLEIDRFIDYGSDKYGTYFLLSPAIAVINKTDRLRFAEGEEEDIIYLLVNDSEMIYTVSSKDDSLAILLEFINK